MLKNLSIAILLFIRSQAGAQSYTIDRTSVDFGAVESWKNDTAHFYLTNRSAKTIFFLPTLPADDIQVFISSKAIAPGATIHIGLVYYTERKGRFSKTVSLFFSGSNVPLTLSVKGTIKEFDPSALVRCPSLEPSHEDIKKMVPVSIVVRDLKTNLRLDTATVSITSKNGTYACGHGFGNEAYVALVPDGKYNINVSHNGYKPWKGENIFEQGNNTFIVYLEKSDLIVPVEIPIVKVVPIDTTVMYIPSTGFSSLAYKSNNIVFLIDVSGSMKDSTKLKYLKTSMKQLISILRPQDFITIITYASTIKVPIENISGSNKGKLDSCIDKLVANGGSRGAEGVRMAFNSASKHFIKNGNNQVILSTDGLFNDKTFTEDAMYQMASENAEKGIKLSVVAFGKNTAALTFLETLSNNGKGAYIRILNREQALSALIEEIKKQSYRL
ncbi:MAG: VWA domain-containing protein [Bacteroidia bacterium]|nr:VWA domain-containing protein [Bacteroidia bacterium]